MSLTSEIMKYGRQMEYANLREHQERADRHMERMSEKTEKMNNELMKFNNLKVILKDELDKETLERIYKRLSKIK